MDIDETIERANALRDEDEIEAAQELLLELLDAHPEDALVLFEVGGSYDIMGQERQAVPYYMQAIANGLSDDVLQECLVCLGSSLRYTGQFQSAIETLEEAVERFPDQNSGRVFLAMAYYSHGRHQDAVRTLLATLLDTTADEDILAYENALSYYMENLDETDND